MNRSAAKSSAARRRTPALAVSVALVAALACLLPAGCGGDEPRLTPVKPSSGATRRATLTVAGREVTVELAFTQAARSQGLMHRTRLEPDHGMLFLFVDEQPRGFWMRDTLIDLDIAFLDDDGRVLNIEHGRPGVEKPGYRSAGPARFVLEMAHGWCAEAGFGPGDRIEIDESLRALAEPDAGPGR